MNTNQNTKRNLDAWTDVTFPEYLMWIAILSVMTVVRHSDLKAYWGTGNSHFRLTIDCNHNTNCILRINTTCDPKPKEFDGEPGMGKLLATVKRLVKPWFFSGRTAVADSWFGSPAMVMMLERLGLYSVMQVVKRRYWPRGMPSTDIFGQVEALRGSHFTMKKTTDDGNTIFACAYRDLKVKAFMSSCGTTSLVGYKKIVEPNGSVTGIKRPQIVSEYEEHKKFSSISQSGERQADQINDGDSTFTNPLPRNATPSKFEIAEDSNNYNMSSPSIHIEHPHKPKLRRLQISNLVELFHFGTSFSKSSPITETEYLACEEDQQMNKSLKSLNLLHHLVYLLEEIPYDQFNATLWTKNIDNLDRRSYIFFDNVLSNSNGMEEQCEAEFHSTKTLNLADFDYKRPYGKPLVDGMKIDTIKTFCCGQQGVLQKYDVKDVDDDDSLDRDDADVPKTHLNLPRALTFRSKQANQGTGLVTFTNSMSRKKKTTAEGHSVMEIEKTLANNSLLQCSTADDMGQSYSHHTNARTPLRSFYHTTFQGKIQKTNGSFLCLHPNCPDAYKVMYCDQVSALAIGLAGLGCLLFELTFPCFDPKFSPVFFVQKTDTGPAFRILRSQFEFNTIDSAYANCSEDEFDQLLMQQGNAQRRALANRLVSHEGLLWTDQDVDLLLNELEIEVGEGTNRFLYQDERIHYCHDLLKTVQFHQPKSPEQIHDKIIWLWTTWEAISRATGKSWWNISEQDKYNLSLLSDDKEVQNY
ncbi:hypothetical protein [Parasitella parasitica]|uniref:PiggyBac transposable element-derived protein domain-containing protein n=1 Tax=Parasitella parasitica TaxID=35722 RepID=A0A0B7NHL9_9FUNG|nr:hypothetical protein [Parasitella parasitica]